MPSSFIVSDSHVDAVILQQRWCSFDICLPVVIGEEYLGLDCPGSLDELFCCHGVRPKEARKQAIIFFIFIRFLC